jgi:hypothetical protein
LTYRVSRRLIKSRSTKPVGECPMFGHLSEHQGRWNRHTFRYDQKSNFQIASPWIHDTANGVEGTSMWTRPKHLVNVKLSKAFYSLTNCWPSLREGTCRLNMNVDDERVGISRIHARILNKFRDSSAVHRRDISQIAALAQCRVNLNFA